jgi:hypothetical protein
VGEHQKSAREPMHNRKLGHSPIRHPGTSALGPASSTQAPSSFCTDSFLDARIAILITGTLEAVGLLVVSEFQQQSAPAASALLS